MIKMLATLLIDFYRLFLSFDTGLLSFLAPSGACKYPISCSLYTRKMIQAHGVLKGVYLGGKRVISCR